MNAQDLSTILNTNVPNHVPSPVVEYEDGTPVSAARYFFNGSEWKFVIYTASFPDELGNAAP